MKKTSTGKNHLIHPTFGARGATTGCLRWDPLVYGCEDGSVNYLFQLDVARPDGQTDSIRLNAHVDAKDVSTTPMRHMRAGTPVTVEYIARTDTYRTAEGLVKRKSYLDVETLYFRNTRELVALPDLRRPQRVLSGACLG